MTGTTYVLWINSLEALSITGVTASSTQGPPAQINSVSLPYKWLEFPRGEEACAYAGAEGGLRTMTVDMIVAVEAMGQNRRPTNYDACITMVDNIATALRAMTSLLDGPMTWRSRLGVENVGGTDYWAIVTEIEGLG